MLNYSTTDSRTQPPQVGNEGILPPVYVPLCEFCDCPATGTHFVTDTGKVHLCDGCADLFGFSEGVGNGKQ
jgi:hypothetical protein